MNTTPGKVVLKLTTDQLDTLKPLFRQARNRRQRRGLILIQPFEGTGAALCAFVPDPWAKALQATMIHYVQAQKGGATA